MWKVEKVTVKESGEEVIVQIGREGREPYGDISSWHVITIPADDSVGNAAAIVRAKIKHFEEADAKIAAAEESLCEPLRIEFGLYDPAEEAASVNN